MWIWVPEPPNYGDNPHLDNWFDVLGPLDNWLDPKLKDRKHFPDPQQTPYTAPRTVLPREKANAILGEFARCVRKGKWIPDQVMDYVAFGASSYSNGWEKPWRNADSKKIPSQAAEFGAVLVNGLNFKKSKAAECVEGLFPEMKANRRAVEYAITKVLERINSE